MRKVTRTGSIRTLNSKHLTVNWEGRGDLIYWMTKPQMRKVFAGAKSARMQKTFCGDYGQDSFSITRRSTGGFSIGCESFTPKEVKELHQWCKQ